jgi:hypothetical protein
MSLSAQLSELFAQRSAASDWERCIHEAFYGPYAAGRGVNKFLALESTLTQTFAVLGATDPTDFWRLVVLVLLQLAQEPPAAEASADETRNSETVDRKQKKKRSQPNAPLAFMMVNALRKLSEQKPHLEDCHIQGQRNEALREFCVRGLRDPNFTVRGPPGYRKSRQKMNVTVASPRRTRSWWWRLWISLPFGTSTRRQCEVRPRACWSPRSTRR